MNDRTDKYPHRTRRNTSIRKAEEAFEHTVEKSKMSLFVAGRIIGILDDGFVLQDESGRAELVFSDEVNVGDIVDIRIEGKKVRSREGRSRELDKFKGFLEIRKKQSV